MPPAFDDPDLSIVIPVRDECANIAALAEEIAHACAAADLRWEALWIDDGSRDGTRAVLRDLPTPHRFIALDEARGQSVALWVGFRHARAAWIGTLDGDGQNDPVDLPRQLNHARRHGFDLVNGVRALRRDTWLRRIGGRLANAVRNHLTGEQVSDVGCATRVARRDVLIALPFFHGMHRFLPTLLRLQGCRMAEIPVGHRPRTHGRSKYGLLSRACTGIRDLIGVRWLIARHRTWRIIESTGSDPVAVPPALRPDTMRMRPVVSDATIPDGAALLER